MTVERAVRLMAGVMVLIISCTCALSFSLYWLWLTVFVGLNLLQSGIHELVSGHVHSARHGIEGCHLPVQPDK